MSIDKVDFTIHRFIIFCDDTTLTKFTKIQVRMSHYYYIFKMAQKLFKTLTQKSTVVFKS